MSARKSAGGQPWGWHALTDSWARRVVERAGVQAGDLVIDVGAGTGAITRHLVDAGAKVIAVELHPARAALLRDRFERSQVTVVQVDASELRLPRRPFSVVCNPPFAISSSLLGRLLSEGSRLTRADIVLQRAAGRRWSDASAPGFSRWSRRWAAEIAYGMPRSAFRPRPPTDCVVLRIRRT